MARVREGISRVLLRAAMFAVPLMTGVPAFAQDATKVDASGGGFTISSGVNSLTLGARAQVRWTLDDREQFDADTAGSGLGSEDGVLSQFDVPRLRLTLSGGALRPWLRYLFQVELGRTGGEGASRIKDAALEIRPPGHDYRVSLGQFKVPFGLQQLTSSGRLQFVDRAITDVKFTPGREMGAMVSGTTAGKRIGYDVGIFNGSGESMRQNHEGHLWAARVYVDPLGPYAPAEGAISSGDTPVLHVGVGAHGGKQIRGRTSAGIVENTDDQTAWNVELAYTRPRFYSTAEHFWMTDEQQNPAGLRDIHSRGYHLQTGFMVVPKKIEIGLLWARIDADTRVDDSDVSELRGVFNYYWSSHNLKFQTDLGTVGYGAAFASLSARARQGMPPLGNRLVGGPSLHDTQLRAQLQLSF